MSVDSFGRILGLKRKRREVCVEIDRLTRIFGAVAKNKKKVDYMDNFADGPKLGEEEKGSVRLLLMCF